MSFSTESNSKKMSADDCGGAGYFVMDLLLKVAEPSFC